MYSFAGPDLLTDLPRFPMSSPPIDFFVRPLHVLGAAARRHREGRAAQSAAALAFALLFALVPLIVLVRQLSVWLPEVLQFGKPLQAYLTGSLLPDDAGAAVVRH
ncbi:hypothetical protein LWT90_22755, partial [Enterobacter hormaechei]|nr:hypothetical protein [Enterobacter hormaechei]